MHTHTDTDTHAHVRTRAGFFSPGAVPSTNRQYLVLPGDGDTARSKLTVECVVCGVQVDPSHRGELLDVHDVLTVNGVRLCTNNKEALALGLLESFLVSLITKNAARVKSMHSHCI